MINIDGKLLTILPALIDPHVHFRVPGGEHKEDWRCGALAAVRAGVTTVCDMPNNIPPANTLERLLGKKKLIDAQLQEIGIPLKYHLYLGADHMLLDQIGVAKDVAVGLKIFIGHNLDGLMMNTDEALESSFRLAKEANLLIAVHAEDEKLLQEAKQRFIDGKDPALHSKIRPKEAAVRAVDRVINLAAKYNAPVYLLHLSTQEELDLVRQAKRNGVPVYAEVITPHLFLSEEDYKHFGSFVQVNPPLRTLEDQEALWEGVRDGTVDTISSDHAPHTVEEKQLPFGKAPSGMPGVETMLPLLLDAVNQGRLNLDRLKALTRFNAERIFNLSPNEDEVLVDLNLERMVNEKELASKCRWSPYQGRILRGWPLYTILNGEVYCSSQGTPEGKQQLQEYLLANRGGIVAAAQ